MADRAASLLRLRQLRQLQLKALRPIIGSIARPMQATPRTSMLGSISRLERLTQRRWLGFIAGGRIGRLAEKRTAQPRRRDR
ncbi:hypothetical protein [Rosistilla oblonga]|uniref:hypothetical protein n=1 Tax=Rosistilla oblonga TaxID=2527990 RepID=UPI00119DA557|nr:hypothetical protein [Rosistilla oblonga]